jgi:uncharacterized membrane protein YcjF (UPF0283 family)
MSDAAIIALAGVITTIVVNYFQERRVNQKFKLQQQAETAREERQIRAAKDAAAALAKKTELVAQELRTETRQHAEILSEKIDQNTKLTGMAYDAANNFELKLERLAKIFDSVHTDREVQKRLMSLAADTNAIVHDELQPDVAKIKDIVSGGSDGG